MMNAKRIKGFTLVELIVVIAIIGVLAAILVPSMLGYVNKAKFTNANSIAKTLHDAGMTACREADVLHPIPTGIYTDDTHAGGSYLYDEDIMKYLYAYFDDLSGKTWAIQIREECVVASCYQSKDNDPYLGTYPHVNNTKQSTTDFATFLNFAENGTW